jgi:hypothetical protein
MSDKIIELVKEAGVLTPQGMVADTLIKNKWPLAIGGLTIGGLIIYGLWRSGILSQLGENFSEFTENVQELSSDTVERMNNFGDRIANYFSDELDRNDKIKDTFSSSVISWIKISNPNNSKSAIKRVATDTHQHVKNVERSVDKVKKAVKKLDFWGNKKKKKKR